MRAIFIGLGFLLLNRPSFGVCLNRLPESEVIRAINLEPNSGAGTSTCEQKPLEDCYCFDGITAWETAEMVPATKIIVNNPTKLALYLSKSSEKEEVNKALEEARKGERVIAIFRVLNKKKNLTKLQRKQLLSNAEIKAIMDTLDAGSLDIAKDLIQAFTPDGVLVTESDKATLLLELQK